MDVLDVVISLLFMAPYFAWGLYTLRLRYLKHEELSPKTEALTVAAVVALIAFEMYSLRGLAKDWPLLYVFSSLGLLVSAVALYGHMLVSLISRVFVDALMPAEDQGADMPQFGPVDALEHLGDYEGALQECYVIARLFPREPSVAVRIGDLQCKLDQPEEAVGWFERALPYIYDSEAALRVTNRLADIYQRELGRKSDTVRVLEGYVKRFPKSERIETVRARIERLTGPEPVPRDTVSIVLEIPPVDPSEQ